MLRIAICDDVIEQTLMLQKYIREYYENNGAEYQLSLYTSGEELLADVEKMDIIFLDIGMPGLDGIETGRIIRSKNSSCRIIMETVMVERMREAFFFEAFRFIVKPIEREEVEEVHQSEIQYVVTYDSYCEYKVKNKTLRSEASLRELEGKLDKRLFFRIHRKYIVNMAQVQSYRNGIIHMKDIELPVARRKKKEFEQAYMEFDLKYR